MHALRLRLTLLYAGVLAGATGVLLALSWWLLDRHLERTLPAGVTDGVMAQVAWIYVLATAGLVMVAAGAGWLLAGPLLDRVQAAAERQRRFVANAGHELRTPLTVIRTEADVTLGDPHASVDELRAMGRVIIDAADRTEELLDGLLVLATAEHGARTDEPVELAALTRRVAASLQRPARARACASSSTPSRPGCAATPRCSSGSSPTCWRTSSATARGRPAAPPRSACATAPPPARRGRQRRRGHRAGGARPPRRALPAAGPQPRRPRRRARAVDRARGRRGARRRSRAARAGRRRAARARHAARRRRLGVATRRRGCPSVRYPDPARPQRLRSRHSARDGPQRTRDLAGRRRLRRRARAGGAGRRRTRRPALTRQPDHAPRVDVLLHGTGGNRDAHRRAPRPRGHVGRPDRRVPARAGRRRALGRAHHREAVGRARGRSTRPAAARRPRARVAARLSAVDLSLLRPCNA